MKLSNGIWITVLTLIFEAIACTLRFLAKFESTRDTVALARFTGGIRIHHSYLGILIVVIAMTLVPRKWQRTWLIRIGWALVASDLIHHFLILWPIEGDPQFDLVYPGYLPG